MPSSPPAQGDVILIEEQTYGWLPVEIEDLNRDVIRAAAQAGRVVVEAAGNGGLSLDIETWNDRHVLQCGHPDFYDSGAILVGAGTPTDPNVAMIGSKYGSRVNCFAAGYDVATTAPPDGYVSDFSGTSSAAAIIAGAAVLMQGYLKDAGITLLNSRQMRWLLSTYASATIGAPRNLGGMPDFELIFDGAEWSNVPPEYA